MTTSLPIECPIECPICFDNVGNEYIECHNLSCHTKMCIDCADAYLDSSISDKLIPNCPGCNTQYIHRNFKSFSNLVKKYNRACLFKLITVNGDKARKDLEIINRLERLREARNVFIKSKFPAAIVLTAQIAMPRKLSKLDKQIKDSITAQSNKSSRTCMNLTCNGSLNSELNCMTCNTSFCKECETRIAPGHICKQSDIESVKVVNESVRCPNCNLPIIKDVGCDHITCANCNTKFFYTNGNEGGGGSHVTPINKVETKILLSENYNEYLSSAGIMDLMVRLEGLQPRKANEIPINKHLLTFYRNGMVEDPKLLDDLAKSCDKYFLARYKNHIFQTLINDVESLIIDKSLTSSKMLVVIEKLEKI